MSEYWDVFDENRKPLNSTVKRGEHEFKKGEYHIVVTIVTMNMRGKLLCTLRSYEKPNYPDRWEMTAGSVLAGEDSLTAAKRELFEETGIKADDDELKFIKSVREASAFVDCYFVRKNVDLSQIVLQDGETVAVKWVDRNEFKKMLAQKQFANPVERRFFQLKDFLVQQGFV